MFKVCLYCKKEFKVARFRINKAKFCSKRCVGKACGLGMNPKNIYKGASKMKGEKRPEFSGENNPKWKGGKVEKRCIECDKKYFVKRYMSKKSKYCSLYCKQHKKYHKTDLNKRLRESQEYKVWRIKVFTRDNWTCQICGSHTYKGLGKTIILNADHIKPFSKYPEYRFDLNNGRTLCIDCHRKTDTYGRKSVYRNKLAASAQAIA